MASVSSLLLITHEIRMSRNHKKLNSLKAKDFLNINQIIQSLIRLMTYWPWNSAKIILSSRKLFISTSRRWWGHVKVNLAISKSI